MRWKIALLPMRRKIIAFDATIVTIRFHDVTIGSGGFARG